MIKCFSQSSPVLGTKVIINKVYPKGCVPGYLDDNIYVPISSEHILYTGTNLPNSSINTNDNLTLALQKIDQKLSPQQIVNAVIQAITNDDTLRTQLCTALSC